LDRILSYYQQELTKVRIPEEKLDYIIADNTPEAILTKGFDKIIDTTASRKMHKIIKILLMELYRNPKVRNFYREWYFNENRVSVIKIFAKLQEQGLIKNHDLELLSSMYNALINFYYHEYFLALADGRDTTELEERIKKHLELFVGLLK
jgi:hypothetical protein